MKTPQLFYLTITLLLSITSTNLCYGKQRRSTTRTSGTSTGSEQGRSCRTIDAAVRLPDNGRIYFFSGNRYLEYDEEYSTEKSTGPISRLGLNLHDIQALFKDPNSNNQTVLASGCNYYRYNNSQGRFGDQVGTGRLDDLGLPCDIDAAFELNNEVIVTKGCETWNFNSATMLFEKDDAFNLSDLGVSCPLDAAVTMEEGTALLITGHLFWRYFGENADNAVEGPIHTDELNICSWFLCGEADFTRPQPEQETMACNGDIRLCPLCLDQVTLPGLHNAGAGFSHGFGWLNCWVRNHARNISEQLDLGIRHLDIDPCHERCGFLGTCHSYFCGGSICSILKQTRRFLLQNPNEVITINFNHEILDPPKVFRILTRQLRKQLGPLLSSSFRQSGSNLQWPTLQNSILTNRRLFIFYAWIIQRVPHVNRYRRNRWIHTESWLGSTWEEISGCSELNAMTEHMCSRRQYRELVEVSAVPTPSMGACVRDMAVECRAHLIETLQICEPYRYRHGKSPNVLLVDYPEINPQEVTSVFHAVYIQNVHNVLQHRSSQCRIAVDAAVLSSGLGLFFSGSTIITYDFQQEIQVAKMLLPHELRDIDAAFKDPNQESLRVIKGCQVWRLDPHNLSNATQEQPLDHCTHHSDAAVVFHNVIYLFQGCFIFNLGSSQQVQEMEVWGLPCHVDAAMTSPDGASIYVFKRDYYWKYDGSTQAKFQGSLRTWHIDVVRCLEEN